MFFSVPLNNRGLLSGGAEYVQTALRSARLGGDTCRKHGKYLRHFLIACTVASKSLGFRALRELSPVFFGVAFIMPLFRAVGRHEGVAKGCLSKTLIRSRKFPYIPKDPSVAP